VGRESGLPEMLPLHVMLRRKNDRRLPIVANESNRSSRLAQN
jgi:hypothetical protein